MTQKFSIFLTQKTHIFDYYARNDVRGRRGLELAEVK